MRTAKQNPTPPSLDGFTIERLLGKGGMATVWAARQHDPDREVAIKVLDADFSSRPKDIDAFYAEAKAAALLDHPNIVTVFEVGCQHGIYYYVMELAAGYDTGKWLARKGRLPEPDVLTIAESVGVALEYADRTLGLIHCDVKPANIMVDDDGTVRVTDMGIARFPCSAESMDFIAGTPAYMSPEQAAGDVPLDARADIYSLGATLYHLLSGKPLFAGRSDTETIEGQQRDAAPDVRTLNPDVSEPCAVLIARFLAKDRNDRPAGWVEAIALIRAAIAYCDAAARGRAPKPPEALRDFNRPSTMTMATGERKRKPAERHGVPFRTCDSPLFWLWTAFAAALAFAAAFLAARLL